MKNTLTEIKNQVAQRHGYDSWNVLLEDYVFVPKKVDIENIINESILEYAKQAKEAQRESDRKVAEKVFGFVGKKGQSILNNPLVTDKIK